MSHKYLNKLGIESNNPCVFNTEDIDAVERNKIFQKQRKKFGFDDRETWDLDYTLATWLYCHLKRLKKVTNTDLEYHQFNIPILIELPVPIKHDFETKYYDEIIVKRTEEFAINTMIEYLKDFLLYNESVNFEDEMRGREKYTCALKILAVVVHSLWW